LIIKEQEIEEFKRKKQQILNIDRKMMEKKEDNQRYSEFRNRFSDIFKDLDFDIGKNES
jgi:hypothetical protein